MSPRGEGWGSSLALVPSPPSPTRVSQPAVRGVLVIGYTSRQALKRAQRVFFFCCFLKKSACSLAGFRAFGGREALSIKFSLILSGCLATLHKCLEARAFGRLFPMSEVVLGLKNGRKNAALDLVVLF